MNRLRLVVQDVDPPRIPFTGLPAQRSPVGADPGLIESAANPPNIVRNSELVNKSNSLSLRPHPEGLLELLGLMGARIREKILSTGTKSVELFAHEHGIAKSTLSEIINGKKDMRLSTLARIAAALDMNLSELLDDPRMDALVREAQPEYSIKKKRKRSASSKTKT